jgi:uncharacterized protein (DUF433 family)
MMEPAQEPAPIERTEHPHVIKSKGTLGGKARINDQRFSVLQIFEMHAYGMTVDQVVEDYPTLTHALVHDALSYAYDHADEILADAERQTLRSILKDNDMLYVDGRLVIRATLDQIKIPSGARIYTWDTVPEEFDEPHAILLHLREHLRTRRSLKDTAKSTTETL